MLPDTRISVPALLQGEPGDEAAVMDDDKRKQMRDALRQLTYLSQLGLSLIIPILVCVFICYWLTTRFGIGGWVYIPGFILGIGSSCMTAWKFYSSVNAKNRKEKKKPTSFNRHY